MFIRQKIKIFLGFSSHFFLNFHCLRGEKINRFLNIRSRESCESLIDKGYDIALVSLSSRKHFHFLLNFPWKVYTLFITVEFIFLNIFPSKCRDLIFELELLMENYFHSNFISSAFSTTHANFSPEIMSYSSPKHDRRFTALRYEINYDVSGCKSETDVKFMNVATKVREYLLRICCDINLKL